MKYYFLAIAISFFTLNMTSEVERPLKNSETQETAGIHMIAEFWGAEVIEDTQELQGLLIAAAQEAQCKPVNTVTKKFEPQGATAMVLLTESHLTIHTWPELDYMAIDFFACGNDALPYKGIAFLEEQLKPYRIQIKELPRGENPNGGNPTKSAFITKKSENTFGQELTIDLKQCNSQTISSKEKIKEYIVQLCSLIDMKQYGEPFIERFALESKIAAGYSFAQMIETSLISGHFSDQLGNAYINIFSCKQFDINTALEFTKNFFDAKYMNFYNTLR